MVKINFQNQGYKKNSRPNILVNLQKKKKKIINYYFPLFPSSMFCVFFCNIYLLTKKTIMAITSNNNHPTYLPEFNSTNTPYSRKIDDFNKCAIMSVITIATTNHFNIAIVDFFILAINNNILFFNQKILMNIFNLQFNYCCNAIVN